ncbi:MAG: winged helix-turn-helix transcriptional regulator [Thermoleophilaceae bacterium]
MAHTSFDDMTCSVARTLDVVGEWWTPLIVRDLMLGISRFDAIQRDLGISRKVLAQRLERLLEHGVIDRTAYQDNPVRYDYWLTEKGADLAKLILAMTAWGDRWVFAEHERPLLFRHESCGCEAAPVLACSCCGEPIGPGELTPVAGPGLRAGPGTSGVPAALERMGA